MAVGASPGEIDLKELVGVLWQGKWWICGITALVATAFLLYSLTLPNKYQAEGVYAPAQNQSAAGGLASQFGSLAAIAGINLGAGESSDIEQAMRLVKSWPFLDALVQEYDLKPLLLAIDRWDEQSRQLVYDKDRYDPEAKEWRGNDEDSDGEPSSYDAYQALSEMISVVHDPKAGLIIVSVEHVVPEVTRRWVEVLVRELNAHFQKRDVREAQRNIDYLEKKVDQTSIAGMQTVFYNMIEAQTKTLMLAEVSEEYLLKTVVEPREPERKSSPRRVLIVMLGLILGGFLSVLLVLGRHFVARQES